MGRLGFSFEDRLVMVVRPANDLGQESFVGFSSVSGRPGRWLYASF